MGLFRKKQDKVIDLTEHYKQQEELGNVQVEEKPSQSDSGSGGFFGGFFGGANTETSSGTSSGQDAGISEPGSVEERRRRLAKRLKEMTDKMEDLSNQIYHLQQRIELLERKTGVTR